MSTSFKKAINDLKVNPGRTALVVVALAIGLWGIGSLLVSERVLNSDLRDNYLRTSPPHAVLTSRDFPKLDLQQLRRRGDIESAEFRDLSLLRIQVYPDVWIPLWLFGVEDFKNCQLARFYPVEGNSAPPSGTFLIERDGLQISSLRLGSQAEVRSGARNLTVPISGISFDPAQAPATQDHFIYAYANKKTFSELSSEPANTRLIVRFRNVHSREKVLAAVEKLIEALNRQGIHISSSNVPKFNEHPHQWQLNTLLLLQASIGLLAFVMGAVLVSQLMASILSSQARQIGIMKAIGGSPAQIFRIYLTMLFLLSLIAGIIAIPLARMSGYAFSYFVANKLNFDILTTRLPHSIYIVLITAALLLPVILSLRPIVKAIRGSVYDALNDYGIQQETRGEISTSHLPVSSTFVLAFRNAIRRKSRLVITVAAMALGVAIFSSGFNVRESLRVLLGEVRDGMRYDVQVVLKDAVGKDVALAPFSDMQGVARVETWKGGRGELQSKSVSTDNGIGIIALPYNTELFRLKIEKGRWLHPADVPEVVMNQRALELLHNPEVGETVNLPVGGKQLRVHLVGVVWELDKGKIYMDQDVYDAAANPAHLVNSIMFVASDRSNKGVMALKMEIERVVRRSDLSILYVMSQAERVKVIYDHLNIILTVLLFLAFVVLLVSAIGMSSAMGINIMERTREIGVLKAIGGTPRRIYSLFVTEGMIVSTTSVALGMLLSWPLSRLAAPFFGNLMLGNGASLRYAFSISGFVITLITTLLFGWAASRIPAGSAVRISTREALAYQ